MSIGVLMISACGQAPAGQGISVVDPPVPPATGSGDGGLPAGPDGGGSSCGSGATSNTRARLRRLSRREYVTVVEDLLGAPPAGLAEKLPPDTRVNGFDNQAEFLTIGAVALEQYAAAAAAVATEASIEKLAPCPGGDERTCALTFIRNFGRRAFGRPLDEAEVQRLDGLRQLGATGGTRQEGVRLAIEAMLQSPSFLYTTELGGGAATAGAQVTLTDLEIASQLSFLVLGTRPDEALLQAAERGALRDPAARRAQAQRLGADARARGRLRDMVLGWLSLVDVAALPKDPRLFPELTDPLRAAMADQAADFIDDALTGPGGSVPRLFTATPEPTGAMQALHQAEPAGRRRGVLSLPLLLAIHAAADHSSPVRRGVFVRRQLFCQDLPVPPPDALARAVAVSDKTTTTREKFAQHSADPTCRGCHALIDPIGFGLEEMDPIGRFRTREGDLPVDSRGELTVTDVDGPFTGPAELADRLARSGEVTSCFVTQFFRFAEGRPETPQDACALERLQAALRRGGHRAQDLLLAFVERPEFVVRRADR